MPTEKPKGFPFPFLRNSSGRADGMWTLCVVAFGAVILGLVAGGSTFTHAGLHVEIPKADAAAVVSVLGFVAGYVVRRKHSAGVTP